MKNLLLVYGHALSRLALRELLKADDNLRLTSEANSVREAMTHLRKQAYDLVMLDVSAPEKNGLESFCDLKQAASDVPVLIINGSERPDRMAHFIRLGCAAYLSYTTSSARVLAAIQAVAKGHMFLTPDQQQMIFNWQTLPHERLSLRELQVFFKLIKGQAVNAIALELSIAPGSVSVFRSKILKKMDLANNAALIHYALAHQLIPTMGTASKPITLPA